MTQTTEAPAAPKIEVSETTEIDGATVIARSLKSQGIDSMFGVVGFPVFGIARAAQKEGIRYYGFRNEQAASYAAGAVGYLTGRPGVCLAVSGPGMVHGIAGLSNAWANRWPMLLLGGANDAFQNGMGAFQEAPQIEAARPFVKYAAKPDSIERLPYYIEQAVRTSIYGRPGAAYIDLSNDIISGSVAPEAVEEKTCCPEPPRSQADPKDIDRAMAVLRSAERPLVIVGKGAAYARAENEVRDFIHSTGLPFLPTPMGKGVVPDDDPLSVAPARSYALQNADVILLLGARLNWILHFGSAPRFASDARFIQLDIAAEEIGTNQTPEVALVGDARAIVGQLNDAVEAEPWSFASDASWRVALAEQVERNRAPVDAMEKDDSAPMGYYRVLADIRDRIGRDAMIIAEGANTMDISRTVLPNFEPRHRLDAGSFGTMGVGTGFAIAAATVHSDKKVICVQGDSAFGFSGMEVEVACRYRLPITFIVINNNGIMRGIGKIDPAREIPPTAYTVNAHYEQIIEAFGGTGFFVTTPEDLGPALDKALAADVPTLVNVMIDPKASRKPQKFQWMTR